MELIFLLMILSGVVGLLPIAQWFFFSGGTSHRSLNIFSHDRFLCSHVCMTTWKMHTVSNSSYHSISFAFRRRTVPAISKHPNLLSWRRSLYCSVDSEMVGQWSQRPRAKVPPSNVNILQVRTQFLK